MRQGWLSIVIICLSISSAFALQVGDPTQGEKKAVTCYACHSRDGNSVNPEWPKIAGQHASYLAKQLYDFKEGQQGGRFNPLMLGIASVLSDQDMLDLAAFYESQVMSPGVATTKMNVVGCYIMVVI